MKVGQREESEYLLEAGQRLESWKRGKEMHFRKIFWMEKGRKNNKKKGSGGRGGIAHSSGFNPYTR